ncbi:MAG: hypothetical protein HN781_07230 [Betaproteobacteria bacterium]|nr:hypothetical protein [Betaproteobacteria bacterium]MBT7562326.1 hypothetical protein [Pseudomonadota bacterium]
MSVLELILICKKDAEAMVAFYGGQVGILSCPRFYRSDCGAAASSTSTYLPK